MIKRKIIRENDVIKLHIHYTIHGICRLLWNSILEVYFILFYWNNNYKNSPLLIIYR